jgi:predicted ATPase
MSMLSGETGIGKTRCAEEFINQAQQRGIRAWKGRCLPTDGAPALWPWIEILRDAVAAETSEPLRSAGNQLLDRLVPRWDAAESAEPLGRGNLFWLLDRIRRYLRQTSELAPRLLFIDDLQWADDASLSLLSILCGELPQSRLLILIALRDPPPLDAARSQHLARLKRRTQQLSLLGLAVEDVRGYLEQVASAAIPLELAQVMHARTAGNPLFIQECVRVLLLGGASLSAETLRASEIALPGTARTELLQASVATLPEDTRALLEVASVLGSSFELALLERVSGMTGHRLLDLLEAAGSVIAADPGHLRFRFAHELLREALYEQIPSVRRARCHLAVAQTLEASSLPDTRAGDIAYHAYRALPVGPPELALHHARRAARAASAIGAHADAIVFYRWALDALQLAPEPELRLRCELLIGLGSALRWAGRVPDSQPYLEQALSIARDHQYHPLLALTVRRLRPIHVHALQPDAAVLDAIEATLPALPESATAVRVELLSQLACLPPHALSMERSKALSAHAVALARGLTEARPLFEALRSRLYALSGPADIAELLCVTDEILALCREPVSVRIVTEVYIARFYARLQAGDMREVDAALHALARLSAEDILPEWQWQMERLQAMRALHRGEFDTAERSFQDLHERAARHSLNYGDHYYAPQSECLLRARGSLRCMRHVPFEPPAVCTAVDDAPRAFALVEAGRTDECWKLVDRLARDAFEQIPQNRSYLWALCQLALATAQIEHPSAASQLYALLCGYSDHNAVAPHGFSMGSVACFAGILASKLGRTPEAIAHLEHAIARNDATGQPAQSARARFVLGQTLAATRSRPLQKRARMLAAEAKATAEQLDMRPLLGELQLLIARL